MFRILRAFAWLRWRMLVNSLERTGARDTVERFSIAIENLGPIMAGILMIPSALALAALGAAAGFSLGSQDERGILLAIIRYLLLAVPVLCIVGPLLLPAADRTNPVRLLLLPIPRHTMYVAQSSAAFGDPWILLLLPVVIGMPLGLAAAGAAGAAAIALVAGLLLVVAVVGLSSLATSALHLAVRDRRRGELLALFFIMILPVVGMLPALLNSSGPRRDAEGRRIRRPPAERVVPGWMANAGERAFSLVPTEVYVRGVRGAAGPSAIDAAGPLMMLGMTVLVLHGVGWVAFRRVLDSPGSTGARRTTGRAAAWGRTIPFLSPAASAVALAQVRLTLRTPRGRSSLLSPFIMFALFGVMMYRSGSGMDFGTFSLRSGLGLASFTSFVALMSLLPIAMNQFAVDGPGLTLALLSPLSERDYLRGKAVGNALLTAGPALVCILLAALVFPGGEVALWLSIPLGLTSIALVVAPAAATFSAIFPRVVDMNSIGRGSNAHGLAGLLGLLTFVAAGVPSVLLVLVATRWFHQPILAPLFLLGWCAAAYAIYRLLSIPAERILASRRENFAMLF